MKLYTAAWCAKCRTIKKFVSDNVQIIDVDTLLEMPSELKTLPTLETDDGCFHPIETPKDLEKYGAKK